MQITQIADKVIPMVSLCLAKAEEEYRYVALSHCWSKSEPIKTTQENFGERLHEIPWDVIPEVFRDTICLAH